MAEHESGVAAVNLPAARGFAWMPWLLLALLSACVMLGGLALTFYFRDTTDPGVVNAVRVTRKPGIDLQALGEVIGTPDLFVEVHTESGAVRSKTQKNVRVGNGLTFPLPVPLRLADVREVRVFDDGLVSNKLLDRIDRPARENDGERFHFELSGPEAGNGRQQQLIGVGLASAGGLVLLICVAVFIRQQVI